MAKRLPNAKRASRANPRIDRNIQKHVDNILDFGGFEPNSPKNSKNKRRHNENDSNITYLQTKKIELIPRNIAQENLIDALQDTSKTVVFAEGCAGTGKTYIQLMYAIQQWMEGKFDKIVLVRPVVTADGSNLGALPGGIIEKLGPYLGEALSILKDCLGVKAVTKYLELETISIVPIALIRGRSFRNTIILVEESQNIDEHAMKMLLTRIGEGSRMFLNGDVKQSDYGYMKGNGLVDFLKRLQEKGGSEHFAICHFGKEHVERHPVVEETLRIYGEED